MRRSPLRVRPGRGATGRGGFPTARTSPDCGPLPTAVPLPIAVPPAPIEISAPAAQGLSENGLSLPTLPIPERAPLVPIEQDDAAASASTEVEPLPSTAEANGLESESEAVTRAPEGPSDGPVENTPRSRARLWVLSAIAAGIAIVALGALFFGPSSSKNQPTTTPLPHPSRGNAAAAPQVPPRGRRQRASPGCPRETKPREAIREASLTRP